MPQQQRIVALLAAILVVNVLGFLLVLHGLVELYALVAE
jgi:hypothetical protein